MSEFAYLFRSSPAARRDAMGTPERAQRSMEAWMRWMQELDAKGHLKSRGQRLDLEGKIVGTKKVVTDGPFAESKDLVLGFIIVEASDLAEAAELANGCPILAGEGSVEVRPIVAMSS